MVFFQLYRKLTKTIRHKYVQGLVCQPFSWYLFLPDRLILVIVYNGMIPFIDYPRSIGADHRAIPRILGAPKLNSQLTGGQANYKAQSPDRK